MAWHGTPQSLVSVLCLAKVYYKHERSRQECIAELGADKSFYDKLHAMRQCILERKKSGTRAAAADCKGELAQARGRREKLVRKPDPFFTLPKVPQKVRQP